MPGPRSGICAPPGAPCGGASSSVRFSIFTQWVMRSRIRYHELQPIVACVGRNLCDGRGGER
jgi:hypothetical protein